MSLLVGVRENMNKAPRHGQREDGRIGLVSAQVKAFYLIVNLPEQVSAVIQKLVMLDLAAIAMPRHSPDFLERHAVRGFEYDKYHVVVFFCSSPADQVAMFGGFCLKTQPSHRKNGS